MPELGEMAIPGIQLLLSLQMLCHDNPQINTAQLLEHYRDQAEFDALKKLAVWQHGVAEDRLEDEFKNTFQFIEDQCLNYRLETLLIKEKTEGLTNDERLECALLTQALKQ
jgi:DNA primase